MKIEGRKLMREITLGCEFGRKNPIGKRPTGDLIAYGCRHTKAQRMITTPVCPTDGNVMVGIQDPEAKVVIPPGTPSPLGKQLQYLI